MRIRPRLVTPSGKKRSRLRGESLTTASLVCFERLESRVLLAADPTLAPIAQALVSIDDPVTSVITVNTPIAGAASNSTAKDPQSKVWQHNSQWWSVLDTATSTSVYRLDGTTWTEVIPLANKSYNADVKPVGNGNTTYVFLYSGTSSKLAQLSFSSGTYQLVPLVSPTVPLAPITLSAGSDTATVEIDSNNRMWLASDTASAIEVRYADAPYTSWSSPITIATPGAGPEELSAIVGFNGKIGILWSNHTTKRFGFRYHTDGANPATWSADEIPASQSALAIGGGMADDHLNVKAAADGTLYAVVKTAYNANTMAAPEIALLIRRPNGQWDPLYGIDGRGTRPIVELDADKGFLRIIYTAATNVGDIVYKDIPLSAIDANQPNKFYSGSDVANALYPRQTLISGGMSKNATSTKQAFDGQLVIVATTAADTAGNAPYTMTSVKMVDTLAVANQPPVNTVPAAQTMLEDSSLVFSTAQANAISIADPDAGSEIVRVTLTVTGGTAALGGTAGLTVTGNGTQSIVANGTIASLNAGLSGLMFTPSANLNGAAAASVQVLTDDLGSTGSGGNRTDTDSFTINITAVNDAPSFVAGGNQVTAEDAAAQSVPAWATSISAGPSDEAAQALNFIVSNDNQALFSVQPAIAANGTLTFTPAANVNGAATVTVSLHDNGGTASGGIDTSAPQTFTITISAVNDVPSFTAGGDQHVSEDAGAQTVNGWATSIAAGPANEAVQALDFIVDNDNHAMFSVQPAIAADGTLTFTPAANLHGTATVTVSLHDGGGTASGGVDTSAPQTFTIAISAVNDAPSFSSGGDQTVSEDAGQQTIAGWATAIAAGPANEAGQVLDFVVDNDNHALFSVQPAIAADGTLFYTPAAGANGTATVTVLLHDAGGTASGGVDTSASQTFAITISAVNDAPSFAAGGDQTALEDAGAQTVVGWAMAITAGAEDEAPQALNFIVDNDNHDLFSVQPAVAANGTLTYTLAPDANGTATVTVSLHDNGGTADAGVDTSAPQTFSITVTPVNDVPSFAIGADQSILADAGPQTVAAWATAIGAGAADEVGQQLDFITENDNNGLFLVQPSVAADGTLSYTPNPMSSGTTTVSVSLHDDGGTSAGGVDTSDVRTFTISVEAVNPNLWPVNSVPETQTSLEDQPLVFSIAHGNAISVTDADAGTSTVQVTLTAIGGTIALGGAANLTVQGNGTSTVLATGTLDDLNAGLEGLLFTPSADLNGALAASIELHTDDQGNDGLFGARTDTDTIDINLTAVNDAPSFAVGAGQSELEDSGPRNLASFITAIDVGPPDEAAQAAHFVVDNDNHALFAVQPAIAADGTLSYTPAPNANGSATVTISLHDDGGLADGGIDASTEQTFAITIVAVNDAPSFAIPGNQSLVYNSGAQTFVGWVSAISTGPADESGQSRIFLMGNDNNGLFSVQPNLSATGTLTYVPAPHVAGSATVTLVLHDNGGTANGGISISALHSFTITIEPASSVANRKLFYAGSELAVDNGDDLFSDDNAIASDKVALLPGGGPSTFINVSSYVRGITGVMVDLAGVHGAITADDFTFRTGDSNDPNGADGGTPWTPVPILPTVLVRPGAGISGSDRVELIWPDNVIKNTFLEVTTKANANTGLANQDTFYFGNLAGNSGLGDDIDAAFTDASDVIAARMNGGSDIGDITNPFDYNRDNNVDAIDTIIARANSGELLMINVADPPHAPLVGAASSELSTNPAFATSAAERGAFAAVASALATSFNDTPKSVRPVLAESILPPVVELRTHLLDQALRQWAADEIRYIPIGEAGGSDPNECLSDLELDSLAFDWVC